MPYDIGLRTAPDGTPCLIIVPKPEAVPVETILRMVKQQFPQIFTRVYHEIILPEAKLEISGLDNSEDG